MGADMFHEELPEPSSALLLTLGAGELQFKPMMRQFFLICAIRGVFVFWPNRTEGGGKLLTPSLFLI